MMTYYEPRLNYDFCVIKMMTYFKSQDLLKIVNEGYTIPIDITTLSNAQKREPKENQQKDSQALFVLQQAMANKFCQE